MRLAILLIAAISCAPAHRHILEVDDAFRGYFVDFENDGASVGYTKQIDDLIIHFDSSASGIIAGNCQQGIDKTPTISVNPVSWPQMTNDEQQELIYHEMGHCVLNRGHKTALWFGIQDSVMWPTVLPPGQFLQYHSHYVTELFTGAP